MTVRLNQPDNPPTPAWYEQLARIVNAGISSGSTAQRPTTTTRSTILYVGRPYFDTTLNKPIWVKSITGATVDWVDASGAPV